MTSKHWYLHFHQPWHGCHNKVFVFSTSVHSCTGNIINCTFARCCFLILLQEHLINCNLDSWMRGLFHITFVVLRCQKFDLENGQAQWLKNKTCVIQLEMFGIGYFVWEFELPGNIRLRKNKNIAHSHILVHHAYIHTARECWLSAKSANQIFIKMLTMICVEVDNRHRNASFRMLCFTTLTYIFEFKHLKCKWWNLEHKKIIMPYRFWYSFETFIS